MAGSTRSATWRQLGRLFEGGTVAGLDDAQLLGRFVDRRDELAFAALVERHGPMVLGACRAVLKDAAEVEDAFQATFLVLVRRAGSIREGDTLGGWLHRVAYRIAVQAGSEIARRRSLERKAGELAAARCEIGHFPDELRAILHEEIDRLPERSRLPLVLCELEGLAHAEACRRLGWTEGELRGRLYRARTRLRDRLARRGIGLSLVLLAEMLTKESSAAVPRLWVDGLAKAAATLPAGEVAAGGAITATAAGLARAALTGLAAEAARGIATAATLLAAIVLVGSHTIPAGLAQSGGGKATKEEMPGRPKEPPPRRPAEKRIVAPAADREDPGGDRIAVSGRVLGPDGKPVAGAKVFRTSPGHVMRQTDPAPGRATTGADGRFHFLDDRLMVFEDWGQRWPFEESVVAATAPGYGVGWEVVAEREAADRLTLRLVEDRPIVGQIVDLEGRPIPGATIQVLVVHAAPDEDLGPWLEAVKGKRTSAGDQRLLSRFTTALAPKAVTDAEGRFRLSGAGRDRMVYARLDGPTIASQELFILTRPIASFGLPKFEGFPIQVTCHGSEFRHAAAPSKPIVGVVRDRDTKEPLAGVWIRSDRLAGVDMGWSDILRTTTDARGEYRLTGMPKGEGNRIVVIPGADIPYLSAGAAVPDTPGLAPVAVDFELKRGIWIEGRLTDKATGKPLRGNLSYYPEPSNPRLGEYPLSGMDPARAQAGADGTFRIAGMPGPGLLAAVKQEGYLAAPDRDDEFAIKEDIIPTVPFHPRQFAAMARIDRTADAGPTRRDLTLDPGWSFSGTVLDPDGMPLAGSRAVGIDYPNPLNIRDPMTSPAFTVSGFNPGRPRDMIFQHSGRGLVAIARPPDRDGKTIAVTLHPGATLTGRLIDTDGRPQADVELEVEYRRDPKSEEWKELPDGPRTDRDGRFRVVALPAACEFQLVDRIGRRRVRIPTIAGLRPGQTGDLGDVKVKP